MSRHSHSISDPVYLYHVQVLLSAHETRRNRAETWLHGTFPQVNMEVIVKDRSKSNHRIIFAPRILCLFVFAIRKTLWDVPFYAISI